MHNRRPAKRDQMDTDALEDLDFAEDLALLSHTHQDMLEKI